MRKPRWVKKAQKRLPGLEFGEAIWVEGNILIDDLNLEREGLVELLPPLRVPRLVVNAEYLTQRLLSLINPLDFEVLIWPGEGAKIIKKFLGLETGVHINARRVGYKRPRAIITPYKVDQGSTLVIDDVIATGDTTAKSHLQGKLEEDACLAAWLIDNPRDIRLRCYRKIYVAMLVGGRRRTPKNTLSTFLRDGEVLDAYAKRYAQDPEEFSEFFKLLKEDETMCGP